MGRTNHLSMLAMAILAVSMGLGPVAQAQEQDDPPADEECVVPPDGNQTDGERSSDHRPENRADRLADCNGVLKPPPAGDSEFVEPAPDEGKTPVIPPQTLPETPENQGENGE